MLKRLLLIPLLMGPISLAAQEPVTIQVHTDEPDEAFNAIWAYFGHDEPNYTYSRDGRRLLHELSAISASRVHIRTHNLLTSGDGTPALKWGSTNVYTEDATGRPVYNWTIIDRIFDTYRDSGITPYVEIGFMPEALSTHPKPYRHHWPDGPLYTGWSYPPNDYKKWEELIYEWVKHSIDRYGRKEVESWDWEVWNEPNGGHNYWHGSVEQYCKFYDYTAAGVKRALPDAKVGGPATTGPAGPEAATFLQTFLAHCAKGKNYVTGKTGSPIDFISFHAKGRTHFVNGSVEMDIGQNLRDIDDGFAIVASYPTLRSLPIVISESDPEGCAACLAMTHPENGYRNTTQYASYEADLLFDSVALAQRHHVNLQGTVTWAFTFPGQPYFAGFRALATHEIDKPIMEVFRMLGLMGAERIKAESSGAVGLESVLDSSVRKTDDIDVFATHDGRKTSILVWNYNDEATAESATPVTLTVDGLPETHSKVLMKHYRIDDHHSDSYAAWLAMGSPQEPSPEQYFHLKAAGQLQLLESPHWVKTQNNTVRLRFTLPRQAVSLVELTW
ncbi:MAG: GH39 family glycosyl hydrolase [Terriglobia bacterium]